MYCNCLKLVFFICLIIAGSDLCAQEAVLTAGGEAHDTEGSVSYSIGQLAYRSYPGDDGLIVEGVQQAYEIYMVTRLEQNAGVSLKVYPNPATDELRLVADDFRSSELTARLYDLQGRLLENRALTAPETSLLMSGHTPGPYLLRVSRSGNEVSVFKIIKR